MFNHQLTRIENKVDGINRVIAYSMVLMVLFFGIGWLIGYLAGKGEIRMSIKYPVRCKIIDVTGMKKKIDHRTFELNTPDVSKPHIGKEGLAEKDPAGFGVRISLDDGTIIYGYECWWTPIDSNPK